jgi:hypothetical protein
MDFLFKRTREELSERKLEAYQKYAEIIQWGRKFPVRFCERFYGIELLDHQRYVFMCSWITPRNVWCQSRGSGKALALDTKIPTSNGFTTMRNIQVGDYILDCNGNPTKVTYTSEIFIGNRCYKVAFDDGEEIIADENHLWSVYSDFLTPDGIDKYGFKTINTRHLAYRYSVLSANNCYSDMLIPTLDKDKFKYITSIVEVPSVPTKCIQVDNERGLFLCGEKNTVTHNTTLVAPFVMAKSNLFAKHQTYIMSGVGSQSQECFLKIEKIAKNEIASFTGLTEFFLGEIEANHATADGFVHNPASFTYKLFNDSRVNSLNGAFDNNRSKRSNLNIYDESGFAPEDLFVTSMPFITQDSNFALGGKINLEIEPAKIPNQAIFASSASDMSTYFYQKAYKEYAKKMFIGDTDYFVADVNATVMFNAKYNGKIYPVSLLTQKEVEDELKKNKEKAEREYFNKFSVDGGDHQPFKRSVINQYSKLRVPILRNDGNRRFVIAYDPARQIDNSFSLVAELINDPELGYMMEICNGINFMDIGKKNKTPMRYPEQISYLKQMILNYNGSGKQDYENLEKLLIDSGSGGGGRYIGDDLMEDWYDNNGHKHKGIIDKVEHEEYLPKFQNALDKLKLLSPKKYKVEAFDGLVEMLNAGLISFTENYDQKGYIMLHKDKEYEYIDETDGLSKKDINREMIQYTLSFEEEMALTQIDLAKEEIYNFYRYDGTNGNVRYDLSPDQANKMHDDRAYCLAMLGWYLQQIRRGQIINKPKNKNNNKPHCVTAVDY